MKAHAMRITAAPRLARRIAAAALLLGLAACQPTRSTAMPSPPLARSAAPLALGAGPSTVPLSGAGLAPRRAGRRLYLVLRGLTTVEPPGVTYAVYLDLPPQATPAPGDPRRIGTVNFFSARPPGAPNGPDAESPVNRDGEKMFFSFDLTEVAATLRGRGLLLPQTTVTFIPEGTPNPTAHAVVGGLELVEQ